MPIMRACKKDVMRPKVKRVRGGVNLGRVELIVKRLGRKKHFHN